MSAKAILSNHSIEQVKAELDSLSNSFREIDAAKRGFSIEPFKSHKQRARSDKGKVHVYPAKRRSPLLNSSKNVNDTNLSLNAKQGTVFVMKQKYKGTPAMREYLRKQKAEERAKQKEKGEK